MKKYDYSQLLIWSAALVTVVRYAAAFIASDMGQISGPLSDVITACMGLTGLGMGLLDVLGGVYLFDGWRRVMPASGKGWPFKFKVLTLFVFGLMIGGICILVPFTVSRVEQKSMFAVLGDGWPLWAWSTFVNVIPYFLIGGVATGNKIIAENKTELTGIIPARKTEFTEPESEKVRWPDVGPEDYEWIAGATTKQIMAQYHVEDRTARNFRTWAQESRRNVVQ